METAQLADVFADLEFKAVCIESGDYKTASKWQIILKRGGAHYSTEYTQGCGHRVCKATGKVSYMPKARAALYVKGKPAPMILSSISIAEERFNLDYTEPKTPELLDVLYCLVSDAQCVEWSDFEDFCAELGYDTDSRKAFDIYQGCQETRTALRRLGYSIEELGEHFQDY